MGAGKVLDYMLDIPDLKDRVWIHAPNGETVGRFGKMGIDVHTTMKEQLAGASQCRYCTHGHVTRADWERFRRIAWMLWGVYVPQDAVADLKFAD